MFNNISFKYLKFILITSIFIFINACDVTYVEVVEESFPDGSPKIVKIYKEKNEVKSLHSETIYYPNHNKKLEGEYKNEKRDGKWRAWFENGNLQSEGFFKKGLSSGLRKVYYESGNLYYEGNYKEGKQVGEWVYYYPNGKVSKRTNHSKK